MRSINEWVDYTQTLHSREIELSLDRVAQVYDKLFPKGVGFKIISVAGTNGKGSCVAMLHGILNTQGYNVAQYTSPHLVVFNERFKINDKFVSDKDLQKAYEQVEECRGDIPLTFFEFATLAAIYLFNAAEVDVAVMEVGLGGRLDAVNILDADVAIITNITFDHMDWLGNSLEKIAAEKVGIARTGKPCVIGMTALPESIRQYSQQFDVPLYYLGNDFSYKYNEKDDGWAWQGDNMEISELVIPLNKLSHQISNASVAIQALRCIKDQLPVTEEALREGLAGAQIFGRCQLLQSSPHIILDVGHNVDAIGRLADFVKSLKINGKVYAVFGMLKDKEISQCYQILKPFIDEWLLASIDIQRGMSADQLKLQILQSGDEEAGKANIKCFDRVTDAYINAKKRLEFDDCLLVFGSFHTVGDIISYEKILLT